MTQLVPLTLIFLLLSACGPRELAPIPMRVNAAQSADRTLFVDVTDTHLPTSDLQGFSMDARPVDVDGDGDLDVVIAHEYRPNILLLNDGVGHFTNVSAQRLPQANHDSEDVGIGDLDGDGDPDIVIVSEDDQVNELYLNNGQGFFTEAGERLPVMGISNAVLLADIDIDGDQDILIGNNGQNVILINNGNAFFTDETAQRLPAVSDVTQDIELGHVDRDGDLDLLVGNEAGNRPLLNHGHGSFVDASEERLPPLQAAEETREADFGDVDGDSSFDGDFVNIDGHIHLYVSGRVARIARCLGKLSVWVLDACSL